LTIEYSKDGLVYNKAFRRLKNLPFVPVKDIPQAFSEISSLSPNSFTPMLALHWRILYWQIKNKFTNSKKGAKASYQILERVLNDQQRTTNNQESWHRNFEIDAKKHPTMNKMGYQFQKEQSLTDTLLDQIESGYTYTKSKANLKKDKILKQLCLRLCF